MDAATAFLNACESGKGWEGVKDMVSPEASFACQATDALPGPPVTSCKTVQEYADWMKGVCANFGDKATYTVDAAAFDDARSCAIFCCTFGGFSDYVYKISMTDGKVTSLVKVWNDAYAAKIVAGAAPGA